MSRPVYRYIATILLLIALYPTLSARRNYDTWSGANGFEPFCIPGCDTISNGTSINDYRLYTNEIGNSDFEWTTRLYAINNAPGKSYHYTSVEGKSCKTKHPAYGLTIRSNAGDTLLIKLQTLEGDKDPLTGKPDRMKVRLLRKDSNLITQTLDSAVISIRNIDIYTGLNGIAVDRQGSQWIIKAGKAKMQQIMSADIPDFEVNALGYFTAPGGAIRFKHASLCTEVSDIRYRETEILEEDSNPLTGYWTLSEYNLDTSLLQPGGIYKLLILPSQTVDCAYDIVYLSGADKNPGQWQPGMVKAELKPTGIDGVYDAIWYDAEYHPLSHNIRAQCNTDGIPSRYDLLTIRFPFQDSTITLRRIK